MVLVLGCAGLGGAAALVAGLRGSDGPRPASVSAVRAAFARAGIQLDLEYSPSGIKRLGPPADRVVIGVRAIQSDDAAPDVPYCPISLEAPLQDEVRVTLCPDRRAAEELATFERRHSSHFVVAARRRGTVVLTIYRGASPQLRELATRALASLPR